MPDLCLFFQVHQPFRLKRLDFFEVGGGLRQEDDELNARVLSEVAERSYLPANEMFERLLRDPNRGFAMAMSISGVAIEQMERHRPDVLESFRRVVSTGNVELLAEPYYHSLAYLHSRKEFERQIERQLAKLEEVFRVRPRVLANTELLYNNDVAARAETLGFDGVLAEGAPWSLRDLSPNFLYRAPQVSRLKTLVRNIQLSDDLAFRFGDRGWKEWPLTPGKFAAWAAACEGDLVNLFLDYDSIGGSAGGASGIFDFWEALPDAVTDAGMKWVTPAEVVDLYRASREYDCHWPTSWADRERDLSAWTGNAMQREAIEKVHQLEAEVLATKDPALVDRWARLQSSDHFYWMSTKGGTDGGVHQSLSPYDSPHDAYLCFMNALADLQLRVDREALV